MKRVLLTGMSGTGKTTLTQRLVALGHKAVDLDDAWCEPQPDGRRLWRAEAVSDNPFGTSEDERARVLQDIAEVEPRLRRIAHLEIDTTAPPEDVVRQVLTAVYDDRSSTRRHPCT